MPLQKRKARAEDEEDAANPNKRRKTVEETQATSHAASKLQDTDIRLDVVQSQNECENAVSVDERVTQLSKPKKLGDSSCGGQSSTLLNFQSVPVTSVDKPKQDTADAIACPTQTVLAFKSPSESAVTKPDMVDRNSDSDIELSASIADQPERTQSDGDHGLAEHVEDVAAPLTKTADKSKILPSVKAETAKDNDNLAELSTRTATHSKISQLSDESKLTNQLNLIESASASQVAAETETPRPRSDSDQTDRLIPATEFAKGEAAELSETATQADITHLRGDRAPSKNLETTTPPTAKEVDLSAKAPVNKATILYLRSNFEPIEYTVKCCNIGSTLQTESESDISQQSCDLEHKDAVEEAEERSESGPLTNGKVAESRPETTSQQSNDNESISTETGPQFKYSLLYRLLRSDENPKENGIKAQCQRANFSVHKHVSEGSSFGTQYISTSASRSAMLAFAGNKKRFPKKIAEIDVRMLEKQAKVEFIDLTDQRNRENFLQDQRAKNLARKYEEVLVTGEIPASCITTVDTYWESDSDSDDSFGFSDYEESIDSDFDYY